jgi:hypothetical protein
VDVGAEARSGPYIDGGKFSAAFATMSRKLWVVSLPSDRCIGKIYLVELCTVLPPSSILVPPGPPAASLANL